MTDQFFLLHALHENDEQMLSLCAAVGESLLDGHQQLVSQSLINYPAEEERREKTRKKKECQEGDNIYSYRATRKLDLTLNENSYLGV